MILAHVTVTADEQKQAKRPSIHNIHSIAIATKRGLLGNAASHMIASKRGLLKHHNVRLLLSWHDKKYITPSLHTHIINDISHMQVHGVEKCHANEQHHILNTSAVDPEMHEPWLRCLTFSRTWLLLRREFIHRAA